MAHQKHVKLQKPISGKYGRHEIGILGAPCNEIKKMSALLIEQLSVSNQVAYLDADHNAPEASSWSAVNSGAYAQFTNKIAYGQLEKNPNEHEDMFFNEADLVLINGNHYRATQQIIYVHPKKSLAHKLDKLTNVVAIILDESISKLPDYLEAHLGTSEIITFKTSDIKGISGFISDWLVSRVPPLKGLVLTGGKSTRMAKDKSSLNYHGVPQKDYMFNLLESFCDSVYMSVRDTDQASEVDHPSIVDSFMGLGPYGGILSAFREDPNAAWLVVAVDLPYLNQETVTELVNKRNVHKTATCFIDRNDEYPEPLITIWEPRAYPLLLKFLSKGYSCPRKVLLNSNINIIVNRDKKSLTNVNTPEDHERAYKELSKST
jgi:molybdopterin-guanine dinucleotide biosynthesis protein A